MRKSLLLFGVLVLASIAVNAQTYNVTLDDSTPQCLGDCNATFTICTIGAPQNVKFVYDIIERRETRFTYLDVTNNNVTFNNTGLDGVLTQDGVPLANLDAASVVLAGQCDTYVVDVEKNSTLLDIDIVPYVGNDRIGNLTWINSSWNRRIRLDNATSLSGDNKLNRYLVSDIDDLSCAADYSDVRVTWENDTYMEDRNFTWWDFGTGLLVYFQSTNKTGGNHYLYCDNDETVVSLKNPEGVADVYEPCDSDGSLNNTKWNTTGTSASATVECDAGKMHLGISVSHTSGTGSTTGTVKVSGNVTTIGNLSNALMMMNYSSYTVDTSIGGACTASALNYLGFGNTGRSLKDYFSLTETYDPFSCVKLGSAFFNIAGDSGISTLSSSGTGFREITTDTSTTSMYDESVFVYSASTSSGGRLPLFSQSVSAGPTTGSGTYTATTDLLVDELLFGEWSGSTWNESADIDSPEVAFTYPDAGSCNSGNVIDFDYNITEDVNVDSIYYTVNNESAVVVSTGGGDQTGTFSFSISFGTHNVTLFTNDTSGNVGNASISVVNQASCGEGEAGAGGGGGGGGTSNAGQTILVSPEAFDVKPIIIDSPAPFTTVPRVAEKVITANRPVASCTVTDGNEHTTCEVIQDNKVLIRTMMTENDFFQKALESEVNIASPANEIKTVNARFNFINIFHPISLIVIFGVVGVLLWLGVRASRR